MRKALVLPLLASLLLASAGCSSGTKKEQAAPDPAAENCKTLLGPAGVSWVKGSTERETGVRDATGFSAAKEKFHENAKAWRPADKGEMSPVRGSEMCNVSIRDQKPHKDYLSLSFGASAFPMDAPFGKGKAGDSETLIPVSSDVKLVTRKQLGSTAYYVYVKCQVPGAASGQDAGMPLEGGMTDTLTGSGRAEHLKRLLYAAGVVAKKFDCQSQPIIPAAPPSP